MKNNKTTIMAPAKLNLFLNIKEKREDSYHTLDMVMVSVDLCDEIEVSVADCVNFGTENPDKISVFCDIDLGIEMEKNIAFKAANAFFSYANSNGFALRKNAQISIKKRIPSGGGMGGGSSDGAAVIVALNDILQTNFSIDELIKIGVSVGADLPFCIEKHLARVQEIGEKITPIKGNLTCSFVVIKPSCSINTKKAYENFDELKPQNSPNSNSPFSINAINATNKIEKLIFFLEKNDIKSASKYFYNSFEQLDLPMEIFKAKEFLKENGGISPMMTGSGSAVFAVFTEEETANRCLKSALDRGMCCYLCKPIE